jgi:hypothetical protein
MKRFPSLFAAAAFGLFVCSTARAAQYQYDWSSSPGAISSDNQHYQIGITGQSLTVGGSTDVTAAVLSLTSPTNAIAADTFSKESFNLSVTIKDGGATSAPVSFSVSNFVIGVNVAGPDTTNTTPPPTVTPLGSTTVAVNGDTYTISSIGFTTPGPISGPPSGSFLFHIEQLTGNGSGQGPNDSPEPTSMLLAGVGSALAGLFGWKKRRVV